MEIENDFLQHIGRAQYAEENHFLFPSLKVVVEGIGEEKIFEGLELTADDWEEIEEYEYAFV